MSESGSHIYEFGSFRLDAMERLLLKGGRPVPLTPKVFDTLLILVQSSGHLVEKDELMALLWPDAVVEENNLTKNISALRKVLGQGPRQENYIETISKRGYRFVVPVREVVDEEPSLINGRDVITDEREKAGVGEWESGRVGDKKWLPPFPHSPILPLSRSSHRRWVWWAASLTLLLGSLGWFHFSRSASESSTTPMRTIPLTSYKGVERSAAFSPDGNQVAFVWNGEAGDNYDVYVSQIGTGGRLRLTSHPDIEGSPTWSPDGQYIAFIRYSRGEHAVFIVPALGGTERKVYAARYIRTLKWTPDGQSLAMSVQHAPSEALRILLLPIESLEPRPLISTSGPIGFVTYFAFSPDGQAVALVRQTRGNVADIYLVSVAEGTSRRLTFDHQAIYGLDWTRDGQHIVFSSARGGDFRLWKVAITGGEPEMLFAGGEGVYFPAIARQGDRLAYMQQQFEDTNIWRIDRSASGRWVPPEQLIFSTRWEEGPHFSPDGQRIAFISLRSGSREIWVCHTDGSNPVKLTSIGGQHTSTPRWSPDGQQIAFDSRPEGAADIYVMNAGGSAPRRLTTDAAVDETPSWSRDGRWIYFRSDRSGSWQIWKIPTGGGEAVRVTQDGGRAAFESADGQYLYYVKPDATGIWRMSVTGGKETLIVDRLKPKFWGYWAVADRGIYYFNEEPDGDLVVEFYDFASHRATTVARLEKRWTSLAPTGLTVSPDGRSILYIQQDGDEGDLILVENFR